LRDGLGVADGEGFVFVGEGAQRFGDEEVARDAFHGGEDPLVAKAAAAELGDDHGEACVGEVGHV
jgi:hypothetical protein